MSARDEGCYLRGPAIPAPAPRQKHPLRRWWVYCFVAWALWTTTLGHAIVGTSLLILGQVWLRELVLLAIVTLIALHVTRSVCSASRKAVTSAGDVAYRARWEIKGRQQRRAFASTRAQIRRLPQTRAPHWPNPRRRRRPYPDTRAPRTNHHR